jgi:hypothetical protein
MTMKIPFNKATAAASELANIADALARGHLSGDLHFDGRSGERNSGHGSGGAISSKSDAFGHCGAAREPSIA